MEDGVAEMARLVGGLGNDRLLAKLLAVAAAEEEYVEATRDKDALAFTEAFRDFTAAVAAARLPQAVRGEIDGHAGRYRGLFERYVRMTEEIRTIRKGYLRSVQAIDPLLEKLYVDSLDRVAAKRRAIERSTRLLSLPVLAVGGIVLVATALFSLTIALTVTRSVAESKAFAERIASGDRGSRLVPVGRNEFFSLATALNTMAESLHERRRRRQAIDRRAAGVRGEIPVPRRDQHRLDLGDRPRGEAHVLEQTASATSSASSRRQLLRADTCSSCSTPRMRPGPGRCSTRACRPVEGGRGSCCGGVTRTEPTGGSNPTRWP